MARQIRNMLGYKSGKLTVIKLTNERAKNKSVIWECVCECGNRILVSRETLIKKRKLSCGCSWPLKKGEGAFRRLYDHYKRSALKRKLEFTISRDEFRLLTKQTCRYCGIEPQTIQTYGHKTGSYIYNGVDRVNNDIGYTLKNCVACCPMCNYAKKTHTEEYFIEWIKRAYRHLEQKP